MKRLINVVVFMLLVFQTSVCLAGPFGFEYGMSKQDIVKLVGKGAVVDDKGDVLTLSTAPKPHGAFDQYVCVISPQKGLLKIIAGGKDIETSSSGYELKSAFSDLRTALVGTYGDPTNDYDFLDAGSIWGERRDWTMGLLKHERTLSSYWALTLKPDQHVTTIALRAEALSEDKGYLILAYEFEGFDRYADEMKAKKDKVL